MRDSDLAELWLWVIGLIVVGAIFFAMLPKWLKGEEASAVLEAAGYTNVQLDGFRFWECGEDLFGMGFTAAGPSGKPAKGAVCKGIFKGATVRLETN